MKGIPVFAVVSISVLWLGSDYAVGEPAEGKAVRHLAAGMFDTSLTGPPRSIHASRVGAARGTRPANAQASTAVTSLASDCATSLFPWVVTDRFDDLNGDGRWNDAEPFTDTNGNGTYDVGEPFIDEDYDGVYDPSDFYDPALTGYDISNETGLLLEVKQGDPQNALVTGFYYPCRFPPLDYYTGEDPNPGATIYLEWIVNKSPYHVSIGDVLRLEKGNMQGPTKQGCNQIVGDCPTSYFDPVTGQVQNHSHPASEPCPRIGVLTFFDPADVHGGSDKEVTVAKLAGCFVESVGDPQNTVRIRILRLSRGQGCAAFIRVPDDAPTIQAAIYQASSGDTVAVRTDPTGSYPEHVVVDKNLVLLGGWDETFSLRDPSVNKTIVDGQGVEPQVFSFGEGLDSTAVLAGFAIEGGVSPQSTSGLGGGIYINNSTPEIKNNEIYNNSASFGAGIACVSGADALISGNYIHDNTEIVPSRVVGCGIYCQGSSPIIKGNVIDNNKGSGIRCEGSDATIEYNEFTKNAPGAGVACLNGSDALLRNNVFKENRARFGGAIWIEDSSPVVEHNLIEDNLIEALEGEGGGAGMSVCGDSGSPIVRRNIFKNNRTTSDGGGIIIMGSTSPTIRENVFRENVGAIGGGILIQENAVATVSNNTFYENSSSRGGAVLVRHNSNAWLSNNIIFGSKQGAGIWVDAPGGISLACNCVSRNLPSGYVGVSPGATDILLNPIFCSANDDTLGLADNSPCLPQNSGGCGLIGAYGQGDCGAFPTNFSLVEPGDDSCLNSNTPTFRWTESTDPDGGEITYELEYDTDPLFRTSAIVNAGSDIFYAVPAQPGLDEDFLYWSVKAYDDHGDTTASNEIWKLMIDQTPPECGISINGGSSYAGSTAVELSVSFTDAGCGASEMSLRDYGGTWSPWEPYAASKPWLLAGGDGTKAVCVKLRDAAGNESHECCDTITLDETPPSCGLSINNDSTYAGSVYVQLTLSSSDESSGVVEMRLRNLGESRNPWEPYASGKGWTLHAGDGSKEVCAQFRDLVGNTSSECCDTIMLDDTAPTCGMVINNGSTHTNSTAAELTLSCSDAGSGVKDMRFRNDGGAWGSWEPYKAAKVWTLPGGDGDKSVCAAVRDSVGNSSGECCDTITLDQTPPSLTLGILQNPILTNYLDLYLLASEVLDSTSVSVTVDGADVAMGRIPGGYEGYRGDYNLDHQGVISFCASACDLAGGVTDSCRTFAASRISAEEGGVARSADSVMTVIIDPGTLERDSFVLVFEADIDGEDWGACRPTNNLTVGRPSDRVPGLTPPLTVSPALVELHRPVEIRFDLDPSVVRNVATAEVYRFDGESWAHVNGYWDDSENELVSFVSQLGTYQVRESSSEVVEWPRSGRVEVQGPYPNPFTSETRIILNLPVEAVVDVRIYDAKGRLIKTLMEKRDLFARSHVLKWDGLTGDLTRAPAGVYIWTIRAGPTLENRKVILLR